MKFKDAELIGVPFQIIVGKKITDGLVELGERSTRLSTSVRLEEAAGKVQEKIQAASSASF